MLMRLFVIIIVAISGSAFAHMNSEAYVNLQIENNDAKGLMEFSLLDLEHSVGLDVDGDGNISWSDILKRKNSIQAYILAGVAISSSGQSCEINFGDMMLSDNHSQIMLYQPFTVNCANGFSDIDFKYQLFFPEDLRHHAIWSISKNGQNWNRVISNDQRQFIINNSMNSYISEAKDFFLKGVWHIWIGLDHILFVILLMLSVESVIATQSGKQRNSKRWKLMLKTVTSFSVAHSITLFVAGMNWFTLPSMWVESIIALSVILAGLNVIYKWFNERLWLFAFFFGLLHGFGFASVLKELTMAQSDFLIALLGFNIGVEVGQIAIVLLALPVIMLFSIMKRAGPYVKNIIASLIIMIATIWLIQRLSW